MTVYSSFQDRVSSSFWDEDVIKVCLMRQGFVPNHKDTTLYDALKGCECAALGYERQTLSGKRIAIDYNNMQILYKADNISFTLKGDDGMMGGVLVYKDCGDDEESFPIAALNLKTPRKTRPTTKNSETEIKVFFGEAVLKGSFQEKKQIVLKFSIGETT